MGLSGLWYGIGMAALAVASVVWYPVWRRIERRRQRRDLMAVADVTREPAGPVLHVVRGEAS